MLSSLSQNFSRISYISDIYGSRFVNHPAAFSHIEDRGYQFSDGVYEVIAIENGKFIDGNLHIARLKRSLKELSIRIDFSLKSLNIIIKELLRRNKIKDAVLYMQVTRGVAARNHQFPKNTKPTIVITLLPLKKPSDKEYEYGVGVISVSDIRWGRRDIKSISLLPNILAKQEAAVAKCREAWLVNADGCVTEGSSSNSFIVNSKGDLVTHKSDNNILGGITRDIVIKLAKKNKIKVIEKSFTLPEAIKAKEAFITSTTARILPVVKIDNKKIGNGKPGEVTRKLMEFYNLHINKEINS